ncbi:MAG: hypothetical protein E6J90_02400 [Deltaproteobacteria bacterium]|nr:MAG: hypothetical protein E6J91_36560 [Deltaproteobacteria bacterium]TMQ27513.1 MAG: hypothetical protein E6J90_02400 [Deltaproteobacteria bacterium]
MPDGGSTAVRPEHPYRTRLVIDTGVSQRPAMAARAHVSACHLPQIARDLGAARGLAVELLADRGGGDLDGANMLEAAMVALAATSKELGTGVLQRGGESPTRT